jgi:hypothetical protein
MLPTLAEMFLSAINPVDAGADVALIPAKINDP